MFLYKKCFTEKVRNFIVTVNTNEVTSFENRGRKRNKKKIAGLAVAGTLIAGLTLAALSQTNTFNAFLKYDAIKSHEELPDIYLTDPNTVLPGGVQVNFLNGTMNNQDEFIMPATNNGVVRHATSIHHGEIVAGNEAVGVNATAGGAADLTAMLTGLQTNILAQRTATQDGAEAAFRESSTLEGDPLLEAVAQVRTTAANNFNEYMNTLRLGLNLDSKEIAEVSLFNSGSATVDLNPTSCLLANLNLLTLANATDISGLTTGCGTTTVATAAPVTIELSNIDNIATTRSAMFFSLNSNTASTSPVTESDLLLTVPALNITFEPKTAPAE